MADEAKRVHEIKIKTGVVKRLAKEKVSYEKETEKMQQKLEKMKSDNPDDYGIRKQQELLEESRSMIPDCQRRLVSAYDELSRMLDSDPGLSDSEEFKAAQLVLSEAKVAANR